MRECLEKAVAKCPGKIFLYFENEEITYREFDIHVSRRANYFLSTGIHKGDVVALFLPNCPEFLYNWFALAKIGAIMVPINTSCKASEVQYILKHSEAKIVISNADLIEIIFRIKTLCEQLREVISIDFSPHCRVGVLSNLIKDASTFLPKIEIADSDTASILYTSGTTGSPKGCILPHEFYTLTGRDFVQLNAIETEERLMTFLPLFHMAAQTTTTMGALVGNASMILIDRFSASSVWEQFEKFKPALFSYIGAVLAILDNLPGDPYEQTLKIPRCYGGGANGELIKRIETRFNLKVIEGYGSTEDGIVLSNFYTDGPRKVGSLGKPVFGREVRIFDENDRELPPYEHGEIVVRGTPMMSGYFKDPEATTEVMRGGWFHTGDHGYMDEEGFFYFLGRKKDILRRAGENISAVEVEDVIRSHPKVFDVAVVGVPDNIRGEEVKACIVLKSGETDATVTPNDIISFCQERLAYFKVPRYLEYFDSDLPRTPTNKVQKHVLKKEKFPDDGIFDREEERKCGGKGTITQKITESTLDISSPG